MAHIEGRDTAHPDDRGRITEAAGWEAVLEISAVGAPFQPGLVTSCLLAHFLLSSSASSWTAPSSGRHWDPAVTSGCSVSSLFNIFAKFGAWGSASLHSLLNTMHNSSSFLNVDGSWSNIISGGKLAKHLTLRRVGAQREPSLGRPEVVMHFGALEN